MFVGGTAAFGTLLVGSSSDLSSSSSTLLVSATPTSSTTNTAYCEAQEEKSKNDRLSRCVTTTLYLHSLAGPGAH